MTRARILSRAPLVYDDGADLALDRPAHVRAGSGLALVSTPRGKRLVIAQDDASFLALVALDADGRPASVDSIALPAGPGGSRQFDEHERGNKQHKLDLECIVVLEREGPLVLAMGSGSAPARERVVLARVDRDPASVDVREVPALYAALRAHPIMAAGSERAELNLEGAALLPSGVLRLFQRGNGKGGVDATFDLDAQALLAHVLDGAPLPPFLDARRWDLGKIDVSGDVNGGVRLTFTDACARGERIYVTAAAEASPNAYDDGEVVGCAFGLLGEPLAPILDEDGQPFVGKPEGLALDDVINGGDPRRAWIVLDKDDPTQPAVLLTVQLDDDA